MLYIQRWLQMLWLAGALLLVYSNYVHSRPDQFGVAALLWLAVAIATLLLIFSSPRVGLRASAMSACVVLLVSVPWVTFELLDGIPHGPRNEGNPVTIFVALLYLGIVVIPGLFVLLLSWLNRSTPDHPSR